MTEQQETIRPTNDEEIDDLRRQRDLYATMVITIGSMNTVIGLIWLMLPITVGMMGPMIEAVLLLLMVASPILGIAVHVVISWFKRHVRYMP